MKFTFNFQIYFSLLITAIAVSACKPDDADVEHFAASSNEIVPGIIDDSYRDQFDEEVESLATLHYGTPIAEPELISEDSEIHEETQVFECSVKNMRYGPEFDARYILSTQNEVIFPGALIDGGSILTGEYTPIITVRNPMTVSISSLSNPGASGSAVVDNPALLSETRTAINDLVHNVAPGSTPASFIYDYRYARASRELQAGLGVDVSGWGQRLSFSSHNASLRETTTHLVRFVQQYYTVDIDLPQRPSDLFAALPDWNAFNGMSPMMVSSVAYGRVVYFMIETSEEFNKSERAIDGAFRAFAARASLSITNEQEEILNNSQIRALVIGGNAESASNVITGGLDGVMQFIEAGADFSPTNTGVPIAYVLRHLKDNSVSNLVTYEEYAVRYCYPIGEPATVDNNTINTQHYLNPDCYSCTVGGDSDFGGECRFSGSVELIISPDNKNVLAKVDLEWDEYDRVQGDSKWTNGRVNQEILLYTAPYGKIITNIPVNRWVQLGPIDNFHTGIVEEFIPVNQDFLKPVLWNGDTGGRDLPGLGPVTTPVTAGMPDEGRAYAVLEFKPFQVMLMNE